MALPSFLQAMFTPQRSGPGQMAWRDKDVGMGSGEIEQGDIQEMYWKRGAAAPGRGQQMTSAVRPQDGMGQTAAQDIQEAISKIVPGADGGGMEDVSITKVMQSTPVGDEFGGAPAMGYVPPAVGGWADQGDPGMVSDPLFVPSEPSSLPSRPMFVPSEPSTLQGPASALSAGLTERQGVGYQTALPYKPPHTQALDYLRRRTASLAPQAGVGQTDPHTGVPAIIGNDFLGDIWKRGTSGERAVPTPGIPPGQTDPALGVPVPIETKLPEWFLNLITPGRNFRATR